MRSYTTKLTVAALAAATALSLAACGPDNSDPSTGTGGATGAAPAPTGGATTGGASGGAATGGAAGGSTAAPSGAATGGATGAATGGAATGGAGTAGAAGGGAGGGKLPQAGTAVKFGQPATVDFTDKTSNINAKLEFTVTGVAPGSLKDFQDAKANPAGLDGRALYYVSWTMKNLGDTKLTFSAPDSKLKVYDASGNTASFANPVGSTPIAKCTTPSFSGATKGVEFKGCDIVSFPAGGSPVMIGYGDSTDITKVQAAWTK
ncbi:hypothetical protein BX285_2410 [Streptomyces sp. 1114.5]|uniref:hypothetical protein n=1 Tax=Streptomyces sp. 1114.5 TaxID=1938830 RepID=UPI000F0F3DF8|nr:hypothetical protein [Streptomyces sp. 1114.5]RKT18001.1 hypothetical protein BX285_2410 [Streptomyces sp. 1114.5]